ncbi:hypothetical protein [Buchananella hordeovulneris]|uniref:hypothetical protein n=1 Tax=Buchananella hordeovulneris TaxID=52770 RepID=UPI0026DD22EF|nr:hypothetical protein [Buchananella hordeovulneris]MDO5080544.1 hypothetical protein [Buchananella hordeovulneris]
MTGTILAQSNKLPSPQPKAFFLAAAITLLLTLIGCAAEEFANKETASCEQGDIISITPNTQARLAPDVHLRCSGVRETAGGLTSKIRVVPSSGQGALSELAVGESFTVENIGKFTLISAREEPALPFFLSSPDSVGICFEPDPDFTSAP